MTNHYPICLYYIVDAIEPTKAAILAKAALRDTDLTN